METSFFLLPDDVKTFCIRADSFPHGIQAAHQKLHSLTPFSPGGSYYGISRPENEVMVYRAATTELSDKLKEAGYEEFIIQKGAYIFIDIPDFMNDIPAIGCAFRELLSSPEIDPEGACIEWYLDTQTCRCMVRTNRTMVTVKTTIKAPAEKVWKLYTSPEHITQWNNASPDWHTPRAENDLRPGGKFLSRMEARDGSMGLDFWGIYDEVKPGELITYTLGDERKAGITFSGNDEETSVTVIFETENTHPAEMQRAGWQAILDNFKKYAEGH